MKKTALFLAMIILLIIQSCSGTKKSTDDNQVASSDDATTASNEKAEEKPKLNALPWDFPEGIEIKAEPGDYVLAPGIFFAKQRERKGEPMTNDCHLSLTTIQSVGKTHSVVKGDYEVPNSLIIPFPKGEKVKKGDIVLTYSNTKDIVQAIVTDDSDPTQPEVSILDHYYHESHLKSGKHEPRKLKPNSFKKLNEGAWEPGALVGIMKAKCLEPRIIINTFENKVLVKAMANKIESYNRDECQLIPTSLDFKEGDKVSVYLVGDFNSGYTVTKVDKKLGRIFVEGRNRTPMVSAGFVIKEL